MTTINDRLKELNIVLPTAPAAVANYVPYTMHNGLLVISGQIPIENGEKKFIGRLGDDMSLEDGQAAARLCAINVLTHINIALNGQLGLVTKIMRLGVFVACTPEFTQQSAVANGASDLMVEIFGEAGRHARAAVGVSALPFGVAVEVEAMVAVK